MKKLNILLMIVCLTTLLFGTATMQAASSDPYLPPLDVWDFDRPTKIKTIQTAAGLPNVLLGVFNNAREYPYRYSQDGGVTWGELLASSIDFTTFMDPKIVVVPRGTNPETPRFIIAGNYLFGQVQLYRSGDYGKTWASMTFPYTDGCGHDTVTSLVVSPANPHRLYLVIGCRKLYSPDSDIINVSRAVFDVYTSGDSGVTFSLARHISTDFPSGVEVGMPGTMPPIPVPSPVLADRVYLTGDWALVSDNAGGTWQASGTPTGNRYPLVLDPYDPNKMYTMANGGMTRLSKDSGWQNWAGITCDPYQFGDVNLVAPKAQPGVLLVRCGDSSLGLFRSTNYGASWQQISPFTGIQLLPDYGNPGQILWARADGLYVSTDLGAHWVQRTDMYPTTMFSPWKLFNPPDVHNGLGRVQVFATDDIWVANIDRLYHWDGKNWSFEDGLDDFYIENVGSRWLLRSRNYPNEHYLKHWDGAAWTQIDIPMSTLPGGPYTVKDFSAVGNQVWLVTSQGAIIHLDGTTWTVMDTPAQAGLNSISMLSATEGWAAGGSQGITTILHLENGTWVEQPHKCPTKYSSVKLDQILMLSPASGWAVGSGCLLRWADDQWTAQNLDNLDSTVSVTAASADDAWVGSGSRLLHWDSSQWTDIQLPHGIGYLFIARDALPSGDAWFTVGFSLIHYQPTSAPLPLYLPGVFKNP